MSHTPRIEKIDNYTQDFPKEWQAFPFPQESCCHASFVSFFFFFPEDFGFGFWLFGLVEPAIYNMELVKHMQFLGITSKNKLKRIGSFVGPPLCVFAWPRFSFNEGFTTNRWLGDHFNNRKFQIWIRALAGRAKIGGHLKTGCVLFACLLACLLACLFVCLCVCLFVCCLFGFLGEFSGDERSIRAALATVAGF